MYFGIIGWSTGFWKIMSPDLRVIHSYIFNYALPRIQNVWCRLLDSVHVVDVFVQPLTSQL